MSSQYLCIDLKSFYASVECVDRGLDPMKTNLVVADPGRTEKTICLAVTPSLKSYGISGRPRLFEVVQQVKDLNRERRLNTPNRRFEGKSYDYTELCNNPAFEIDYIVAPPRMAYYMKYSAMIYNIYLKYIAPEDIHVYSIDEVFIDITHYLSSAGMTAKEFARTILLDVVKTTGITATAGIGTNMYLAKIAMDIVAKKIPADEYGARIAELDERSYREKLWSHTPLTDFWRVGRGIANKLEANGFYTMGDVARCSVTNEEYLYEKFGKNAELLIDHAWGWEPCTIADVKKYKPSSTSLSSGQVLHIPYDYEGAKLIVKEMIDLLVLDMVSKGYVTTQIVLDVGYDNENVTSPERMRGYSGDIKTDYYGRTVPKNAHGTANIPKYTSSSHIISMATVDLYEKIVNKNLLIRRITIAVCKLVPESEAVYSTAGEQLSLFDDPVEDKEKAAREEERLSKEKSLQNTMLSIKGRFGKNAILKGMNLFDGATARERNAQVGGHKAGDDNE